MNHHQPNKAESIKKCQQLKSIENQTTNKYLNDALFSYVPLSLTQSCCFHFHFIFIDIQQMIHTADDYHLQNIYIYNFVLLMACHLNKL